MSKILIVGASILQLPAIIKAKEMGHYVAVADYNPQAIGVKYADEFYNASTIDPEAICRVAEEFRPDGIMTLATDMPMRSIAAATTKFGLPGISYETAYRATDKAEMIRAFDLHKVSIPWYYIVKNVEELNAIEDILTFPCVMKPVDNSGSRGVVLIKSKEELKQSYLYSLQNARSGSVIVEEYLQGQEVSVEIIVTEGLPNILAITDKMTTGAPHFVELGHTQPSRLESSVIKKIQDLANKAVLAIGLKEGAAHVEIMQTDKGPKMIEIGARMGGDCITTHLVPLSTGIDMVKATIDISIGNIPDVHPQLTKGSAIRYFQVSPGLITNIRNIEKAQNITGIKEIVFTKKIGDRVTPICSSTDRVGYIIAQGNDANEAEAICDKALAMISFDIK